MQDGRGGDPRAQAVSRVPDRRAYGSGTGPSGQCARWRETAARSPRCRRVRGRRCDGRPAAVPAGPTCESTGVALAVAVIRGGVGGVAEPGVELVVRVGLRAWRRGRAVADDPDDAVVAGRGHEPAGHRQGAGGHPRSSVAHRLFGLRPHRDGPAGSTSPAKPLLDQYGEPGPEYGCRIGGNSPCQPSGCRPCSSKQPDSMKYRSTPLGQPPGAAGGSGVASKSAPAQNGPSIAYR